MEQERRDLFGTQDSQNDLRKEDRDRLEGFAAGEMADRGPKDITLNSRNSDSDFDSVTGGLSVSGVGDDDDDDIDEEDDLILGDEDDLDDDDTEDVADVEIDDNIDDDIDDNDLLLDADDDIDDDDEEEDTI
jgi:hypothetical protein